jgi:hypothetical protein
VSRKKINFKEGFSEAVAQHQKVWAHDRSTTVGASEVFGCLRAAYFDKREPERAEEPEEVDTEWGHTERGNLIENEFAVPCLRAMFGEDNCFYMGTEQKTFVDGRLSATPDGTVTGLESTALLDYGVEDIGPTGIINAEIKSFGGEFAAPKKYKAPSLIDPSVEATYYQAKPRHEGQGHVQMGLMRRKTNYQPDYVAVIYISSSNLKDIRVAPVKYDDRIYQRAKARAESVFDPAKSAKDFPPEGKLRNDCQYCKYVDACAKVEAERYPGKVRKPIEFSEKKLEEFRETVKSVAKLRAEVKELTKKKEEAEFTLKEMIIGGDTTRIGGEGWYGSLSQNAGRKSLDKARLEEELDIDLNDYTTEGNPYFVLRVKYEE